MKKIISIIVIVAVLLGAGAVSLAYYNKYTQNMKKHLMAPITMTVKT